MGVVGFLGVAYLRDWNFAPAFAMLETKVYETGRNYTLSVVPLFILMGNLVTRAGMSQELFRAANTCIGHLRGGLPWRRCVPAPASVPSAGLRSRPPPPWPRSPIPP